jgi:hypothetical protein
MFIGKDLLELFEKEWLPGNKGRRGVADTWSNSWKPLWKEH